tara:strand:- start:115 stop:450 length:336 start_codon:yes stop_codon:yes gene_type:complete
MIGDIMMYVFIVIFIMLFIINVMNESDSDWSNSKARKDLDDTIIEREGYDAIWKHKDIVKCNYCDKEYQEDKDYQYIADYYLQMCHKCIDNEELRTLGKSMYTKMFSDDSN